MILYRLVSYAIIFAVFVFMGLYLDADTAQMLIFPSILIFSLAFTSHMTSRGRADKKTMLSIKILTYLYISSLVFFFAFITNNSVVVQLLNAFIGSASIIGYLIAISHTGRDRNEV